MAMNDLFSLAGAKPKLITAYTSGTGTYVPTENNARCFVRVQAGGGSGGWNSSSAAPAGGGGGACLELLVRIPIAGWVYVIGAGGAAPGIGAAGNNGSPSSFGIYKVMQGFGGSSNNATGSVGGFITLSEGSVNATSVTLLASSSLSGYSGGAGGNGTNSGKRVGFSFSPVSGMGVTPVSNLYSFCSNDVGNGSGGDSFFGRGANLNLAPPAGNYGAGGGGASTGGAAGGAGLGGYIEIWDFGA